MKKINDIAVKFPNLTESDIYLILDSDDNIDELDELYLASQKNIICIVTNRDGDIDDIHRISPTIDDLNDLVDTVKSYSGPWGDYHHVSAIIYQGMSYEYRETNQRYGTGSVDVSKVLGKASLTYSQVLSKLNEAINKPDTELRESVANIISRMRN